MLRLLNSEDMSWTSWRRRNGQDEILVWKVPEVTEFTQTRITADIGSTLW